jgi:hypothetical protein
LDRRKHFSLLVLLAGDWWSTRARMREVGGLSREVDAQRAISVFNRRMADVQKAIARWRELHARIWEPFDRWPTEPRDGEIGNTVPSRCRRAAVDVPL